MIPRAVFPKTVVTLMLILAVTESTVTDADSSPHSEGIDECSEIKEVLPTLNFLKHASFDEILSTTSLPLRTSETLMSSDLASHTLTLSDPTPNTPNFLARTSILNVTTLHDTQLHNVSTDTPQHTEFLTTPKLQPRSKRSEDTSIRNLNNYDQQKTVNFPRPLYFPSSSSYSPEPSSTISQHQVPRSNLPITFNPISIDLFDLFAHDPILDTSTSSNLPTTTPPPPSPKLPIPTLPPSPKLPISTLPPFPKLLIPPLPSSTKTSTPVVLPLHTAMERLKQLLGKDIPLSTTAEWADQFQKPYLERVRAMNHEMQEILEDIDEEPDQWTGNANTTECHLPEEAFTDLYQLQNLLRLFLQVLPQSLGEIQEALENPEITNYFFNPGGRAVFDPRGCMPCYRKDDGGICREITHCKNGESITEILSRRSRLRRRFTG